MRPDSGTPADRRMRVERAVAASSTATFAALVSHVVAGGAAPPALGVAAVLVLSWLPALALAGRRPSRTGLALVVLVSEAAFHAVFTLLGTGGAAVPQDGMAGMPGMSGAAAGPVPPAMAASPAMWLAHAAAAALTIALCLRGESAARALLAVLGRLVLALLPLLTAAAPSSAQPVPAAAPGRLRLRVLLDAQPRRGPPAAALH